jgi:hypothetical protein
MNRMAAAGIGFLVVRVLWTTHFALNRVETIMQGEQSMSIGRSRSSCGQLRRWLRGCVALPGD